MNRVHEVTRSRIRSDAADLQPERARCEREIAIVRRHHEPLTHPILPHQSGRQVQRIEGSEGRGKRFRCAGQDRTLEQDEVDGLEPFRRRLAPRGRVLRRKSTLKAQAIDRAERLDRDELARDESFAGSKLLERVTVYIPCKSGEALVPS